MPYTIADIAKHLGGEVIGDASLVLKGFAPADRAQPGDLTFAENESYFARAEQSAASAIMVDGPGTSAHKALIRVPNARVAFAKVLPLFFPEPAFAAGIHPTAVVPASAQVDPTAHIGPHCILGEKVRVGARSVLQGLNAVGADCLIGEDVNLFPNVTLYPRTEVGNRVRIHNDPAISCWQPLPLRARKTPPVLTPIREQAAPPANSITRLPCGNAATSGLKAASASQPMKR